jgi:hypothetical protein
MPRDVIPLRDQINMVIALNTLGVMQGILLADPKAMHALIETRVPCVAAVESEDCPAIPFDDGTGNLQLGLLGVINGLMPRDYRIVAVYDDGGTLTDFKVEKVSG